MNLVQSDIIFKALTDRWKELDLSPTEIVQDANERGMTSMTKSGMSKYRKRHPKGAITEEQLHWLLIRYHIPFSWDIGIPVISKGKLKYELPKYNELSALTRLKEVYGDPKKNYVKFTEIKDVKKK